jgi:stage II sporulation SpoE-like protein
MARDEQDAAERAVARARMFGALVTVSHLATLEQLPDLVARHGARVGLDNVVIYLSDLQQEVLSPLGPEPAKPILEADHSGQLRIEGTVPGRAFQHGEVLPGSPSDHEHWWVPLLNGSDRLGVLHVTAPGADAATLTDIQRLASLVGLMVVSKRQLSDSFARLVRRKRMDVAAEMEWRLMPPRTFATDHVMISAVMEPAYEISGDAFDYAFDGRTAHLAVFDAMGHDTAAGLTANLALSAFRNCRRQGGDLTVAAETVSEALMEQFAGSRFATGFLGTLHADTGILDWVNCGHPLPVIIRGHSVVHPENSAVPPMGLGLGGPTEVSRLQLEPGDRLLVYTDGVTEARSPQGEEFGLERFTDFLIRHQADELPVPETLRRLIHHHLAYHDGRLGDDATVLLVEWHGVGPYAPGEAEDLVGLPDH